MALANPLLEIIVLTKMKIPTKPLKILTKMRLVSKILKRMAPKIKRMVSIIIQLLLKHVSRLWHLWRTLNETFTGSVLDIEKRKLEYLQAKSKRNKDQEEEHLLFSKRLLPHVRKILQSRILSFRCRVQEFVNQSAYYERAICMQPSTSSAFTCSGLLSTKPEYSPSW